MTFSTDEMKRNNGKLILCTDCGNMKSFKYAVRGTCCYDANATVEYDENGEEQGHEEDDHEYDNYERDFSELQECAECYSDALETFKNKDELKAFLDDNPVIGKMVTAKQV